MHRSGAALGSSGGTLEPTRSLLCVSVALEETASVLTPAGDVTELLQRWSAGDAKARDALVVAVYDELRTIARRHLRRESRGESLAPTGLVHEAYARLIDQSRAQFQNRGHFFAIASQVVRRVLVDRARARNAQKRGAGEVMLSFAEGETPGLQTLDVTALDAALTALAALDERQARLVELRFFGGLSIEETAEVMEISTGTVKREWRLARSWLQRELTAER